MCRIVFGRNKVEIAEINVLTHAVVAILPLLSVSSAVDAVGVASSIAFTHAVVAILKPSSVVSAVVAVGVPVSSGDSKGFQCKFRK